MKQWIMIFLMSAVPVIEQRGAIPLGILGYGMDPINVFIISLLGSLLPFPFIYFFVKPLFKMIKQKTSFGKWVEKIEKRTLSKSKNIVNYKVWGLLIFVGIPLPGTGIWTGSLAAVLLKLKPKYALVAILGGAIMSAVLITLGVTGVVTFLKF